MISKKMEKAFNDQIAAEFYSAHLYLAMAAWCEDVDLPGLANWMKVQYQEELFHGMKMFNFLIERDGRAIVNSWDKPQEKWKDPVDVFKAVYAHEQKVTKLIHKLVDLALAEKDHASHTFLQWYVDEQVEEEATSKGILQQLKMIGDNKAGLYQIDRELAQRSFSAPA